MLTCLEAAEKGLSKVGSEFTSGFYFEHVTMIWILSLQLITYIKTDALQ